MATVRLFTQNLCEAYLPTLVPASGNARENLTYPLRRLYDRSVARQFRTLADSGFLNVQVDVMASRTTPTLLLTGHNLDVSPAATLEVWTATTLTNNPPLNGDYSRTTEPFAVPSGTLELAIATGRAWRIIATTSGSPLPVKQFRATELWIGFPIALSRNPARPAGVGKEYNATVYDTSAGYRRWRINGPARRRRSYHFPNFSQAQRASMETELDAGWLGGKPFWLYDHEGTWIFGGLEEPFLSVEIAAGRFSADFEFLESIG